MNTDVCPHCGVSLIGDPIPDEHRHMYGKETHWRREIGCEVPGAYDGVLYWMCPDCGWAWNRWPGGHPLHRRAAEHVTVQNGLLAAASRPLPGGEPT